MADDQYALCWNNYNKNLTSGFHALYSRGDFTDVTLSADGNLIQAHRIVLAVCSPYFKNLFENTPPANHPIIYLKDISYKNLTDLVQFMYCGEVHVRQEDLANFISIAESLQIKGLTESDNENSFYNTRNSESRSTRAAKRAIKKDSDESYIPAKYKRNSNLRNVTRNSTHKNNDPLRESVASTSQSEFSEVRAKQEPNYDQDEEDIEMDSNFIEDNFNSSALDEKTSQNIENESFDSHYGNCETKTNIKKPHQQQIKIRKSVNPNHTTTCEESDPNNFNNTQNNTQNTSQQNLNPNNSQNPNFNTESNTNQTLNPNFTPESNTILTQNDPNPTQNDPNNSDSSTTDDAPVEFFPTKMGGYVMVHDQQMYSLERKGGIHLYWCCNLKGPRRCPARCQTTAEFDSVVIRNSNHNHPPRSSEIARRRLRATSVATPDECGAWMARLEGGDRVGDRVKEEHS